MPRGICSECSNKLERANQRTCSSKCRSKRARRLKKVAEERGRKMGEANALPPHQKALSAAANKQAADVAHELLKEELRPVVRESLTQDVLEGIGKLVGLTPMMIAAIEEDLASDDKYLRQKAYSLLARYTLGNQSVAPAPANAAPAPMQVVFQLPRPGDDGTPPVASNADELRTCMECHAEKPADQFVGNSERCTECHEGLQARIQERFG